MRVYSDAPDENARERQDRPAGDPQDTAPVAEPVTAALQSPGAEPVAALAATPGAASDPPPPPRGRLARLAAALTERRPVTWRELLLVTLLAAGLVTCFLSEPIFTGRYLTPADMLIDLPPWGDTGLQPPPRTSNPVIGDSTLAFEPWRMYAARRLQEGSIPLWNPDNFIGEPFVGNSQTAVFYPFNWIYDLIPNGHTFLFLTALKLVMCCVGSYLFARQVANVGPLAASVAMITYSFGAFMSVWLVFPLSDATLWLPWTLWATSRLLARPSPRRAALLVIPAALCFLAGHPETQAHVALATGVFALVEAFRVGRLDWRRIGAGWALWAGAYLIAFCIGSVELLPFVEYLNHSTVLAHRSVDGMEYQPVIMAWTLFSPLIYGSPQSTLNLYPWGPGFYNEFNTYCGVLALLLAPFMLGLRDRAQRWLAVILVGGAILCLGIIYHGPLIFDLVAHLPVLPLLRNPRLVFVLQFLLGVMAALGVQALVDADARRRWRMLLVLGIGAAVVLGAGAVYPWLNAADPFTVPLNNPDVVAIWQGQLLRGVIVVAIGVVVVLLALLLKRWPTAARLVMLALPLALFVDLWLAHGTYTPSLDPAFFFPPSPEISYLQQNIGLARFIAQGFNFPPNTNLAYGLAQLPGYDATSPLTFYELGSNIDGALGLPGPQSLERVQSPLLNLFNVRYLLLLPDDKEDLLVVETAQEQHLDGLDGLSGEISGDNRPGQTFVAASNNMAAIRVKGATYGRDDHGHIIFHLKSSPTAPDDIVTIERDVVELLDNSYWTFEFEPIPDSAGKSYYFYLESPDSPIDEAVSVYHSNGERYPGGTRTNNGTPLSDDLAFRVERLVSADDPWMRVVQQGHDARVTILENVRAQPRAWLTHRAEVQPDKDARIALLTESSFDFAATVVLNAPLPDGAGLPETAPGDDKVTIRSYKPEQVDISTSSSAAGVLVLADQDFPGWVARVDGREAPIVTADHAMRGVYLAAGDHTVTFSYEPVPFRIGVGLATGGTLVLLALLLAPALRRRRAPAPGTEQG